MVEANFFDLYFGNSNFDDEFEGLDTEKKIVLMFSNCSCNNMNMFDNI